MTVVSAQVSMESSASISQLAGRKRRDYSAVCLPGYFKICHLQKRGLAANSECARDVARTIAYVVSIRFLLQTAELCSTGRLATFQPAAHSRQLPLKDGCRTPSLHACIRREFDTLRTSDCNAIGNRRKSSHPAEDEAGQRTEDARPQ